MDQAKNLKTTFERNQQAVKRRPDLGKSTTVTSIKMVDGTTCEVQHKDWRFKVDIGKAEGGNGAGPGPGILERGALGSCLAIAYYQRAAIMEVPVSNIEIEVASDFDARGMLEIDNRPPGFIELRYKVKIESNAPKQELMKVIEAADRHSPVLDDFKRAIPVYREVQITPVAEAFAINESTNNI